MSERLLRFATSFMDRRTSRRNVLVKMAMGGSALAVSPLKYLLEPVDAKSIVTCADCSSGDNCCDGYTTFCCSINADGENHCPSNTFKGGWWKCTDYEGTRLCHNANVRYYLDCNLLPGETCKNGCHCARNKCSLRSTCCNVFRYGQCNTQIPDVTPIVCRIVRCEIPCQIWDECNCTYKEDNNTCTHEAGCL